MSMKNGILIASFKPSLPFPEEVTDDLAKSVQAAAGSGEEFCELLHGVSPVIAFHRGDEMRIRKEWCIGTTEAKRRTPEDG
ncbi:hypothetical protein A4U53_004950 (plasmid) [Rhizobium ruizarguesonis]|uniref:Uncharacterized protein n=1 Tax=Rhizobium ruizarguesonis TaxID=2081791 RepID=A0ACD5EH78_9HYPH